MNQDFSAAVRREPWNKGKLVGQKPPLRLKDMWAVRIRLAALATLINHRSGSRPDSHP